MQNISTNLPPNSDKPNLTTQYFNNYFKPDLSVSQNVDNAVLSYFESLTGDKDTAKVLSSSVLYTALTQGIDPMSIITEMAKLTRKNENSSSAGSNYNARLAAADDAYAMPGPNLRPKTNTELNSYLAMFLNLNRVNTSLLGVSNEPQTNKYIKRAILP